MLGFDQDSYQIYYTKIIEPVIEEYCDNDYGIEIRPNAKDLIWNNYAKLNRHCRENYMLNPEKLMDRHKTTACYMFAILKTDVLSCSIAQDLGDERGLLLNERLALCFGMTLLRALILGNANELSDQVLKQKVKVAFDGEIAFPKVNHGSYKNNLLLQLYYTKKEGNYNILALADSLYLIENYNLIKNGLPEDIFKKAQ